MKQKQIFLVLAIIILMNNIPKGSALQVGRRLADGVSDTHLMEDITFESYYKRSDDFTTWKITNNKALEIELRVLVNPSNKIILVTHMYAVFYIESTNEFYDDIEQDYMDDFIEGSDQGGFFVNETYPYKETFSVKGMSNEFIDMIQCGMAADGKYTRNNGVPYRLTENTLMDWCDVVGQTLYVVYDVLCKLPNEQYFHKFAISDNIFIDLNGTVALNNGDYVEQLTEDKTTYEEIGGYPLLLIPIAFVAVFLITKKIKTYKI